MRAKAAASSPVVSNYEGATIGRLGLWGTSLAGPNVAVQSSRSTLVARSRELVRNNPWVHGGLETLVSNLIGTGPVPFWHIPDDPELAKTLRTTWDRWTPEADADGRLPLNGLFALAAREVVEAGEELVRFRQRFASDGLTVPLQVQLLEGDYLDELYDGVNVGGGNWTRQGVEFDRIGARAAYWLRNYHPGDLTPMSGIGTFETKRVPASEVLHVGVPERSGQVRSLPWLSSLIVRLYALDQIDDARLVREQIGSMLVGVAYDTGAGDAGTPGVKRPQQLGGQDAFELKSGTIQRAPAGIGKIEFTNPPTIGADTIEFLKYHLRAAAMGFLLTFEQFTGDFSNSNFSSFRTAIAEFRRKIEALQWNIFIFQLCNPIAVRWIEVGVATGTLPIRAADFNANRAKYTAIQWRPPRWAYVDPVKDVTADLIGVRAGFWTKDDVIAEHGDDPVRVAEARAAELKRADDLGIIDDSDPRKVNDKGKAQTDQVVKDALAQAAQ